MKTTFAVALSVGLSIAAGLAGYWVRGFTEEKIGQIRDASFHATAMLALEPGINSADPNEREHALWLTLGELRALERKPNQAMSGDIAAMEVAFTYAKLARVHPAVDPLARSELLINHAVSACQKTASPNCNREALLLIARRLSAPAGGAK